MREITTKTVWAIRTHDGHILQHDIGAVYDPWQSRAPLLTEEKVRYYASRPKGVAGSGTVIKKTITTTVEETDWEEA